MAERRLGGPPRRSWFRRIIRTILIALLVAFAVGFAIGTILRGNLEKPTRYYGLGEVDPHEIGKAQSETTTEQRIAA